MQEEVGELYPKNLFKDRDKSPENKAEFHRQLEIYRQKERELEILFKKELFKAYGVADNPKNEMLWTHAYDLGHSSGFSEIEIYFSDLVELIK